MTQDDSTFCESELKKSEVVCELNGCFVQLSLKSKLMISLRYFAHLYLNDVLVCIGARSCQELMLCTKLFMKPQVKDNRKSPPSLSQDFQADVSNFGARTCVFWEEFSLIFP